MNKELQKHSFHIKQTEQIHDVTIQVSALCEWLGITRNIYEDHVKNERIVRDDKKSPLLYKSIRNLVRHLKGAEEYERENRLRIRAQTDLSRARQRNEQITTDEREGRLISLEDAKEEARYLGVLTRQFCERAIDEAVKRTPAKQRVRLRGELTQLFAGMLENHAKTIEKEF